MGNTDDNRMSIRLSDEHKKRIDEEGKTRELTGSQIVREALDEYFNHEQSRKNYKQLYFQLLKLQSIVMLCFDLVARQLGEALTEETEKMLVQAAEEVARAHLQEHHP